MIDNITVKARDLFNKLQAIETIQGGILSVSEADSRYYKKTEAVLLQNKIMLLTIITKSTPSHIIPLLKSKLLLNSLTPNTV